MGWHHQLNGQEFEQTPGDSDGQGSLVCSTPWGRKESDTTYQRNKNNKISQNIIKYQRSFPIEIRCCIQVV